MANSQKSFLEKRLDGDALPLAVGDFVVLIALLTVGAINHHTTAVLSMPAELATTILPFIATWLVFAPLIGAYSAGAAESAKAAIPLAIRSWIPSAIGGIPIWYLMPGNITTLVGAAIFATVLVVLGSLGLGIWRALWFKLS
ncbi:Protein of unknown function [Halogranum rubrum]|uniref:DUF3054 domain-containing protein n=1 Tax=Halogranum rubrum TaxID=553466 RepID=A0A1I4D688_9EURY|nr:DUF3054 domain-containing protein [Halogranum rubrum]SFK88513.1 Protein of unknown function [Halogranum rubrum]